MKDLLKALWCRIVHRHFHYSPAFGPDGPWPSSLVRECQVCGFTVATGTKSWYYWNGHHKRPGIGTKPQGANTL